MQLISQTLYCSCLNIRITLISEQAVLHDQDIVKSNLNTLYPGFQWSLLPTKDGVVYEHAYFVSRHHWDENWLATRCLNCDMDVYAMDTTDSLDPSQEFRPILSCSSLKTEEEASKLRQLTNPEGGKFYSSAFKVIIFLERAERRNDLSESEPKHLGPTLLGEEFQAQLDQTLKMFTKRLQTAMQLKIEEFREEQQRKLYSEVNAAKLAAKYLLQSNRSPAPAALTPTGSQKQTNKPSSATSALQDADSDKDDFSLEASNQPHAAVESDSEDLASSFNEDLFDLDEDASRAQPPRQAFSPPKVRHHAVQEEGVVGSFAAQGRYFLTKAPKFVPTIVEASNESSSDDELDSKISPYAKSLPIPIANFSRSAHFQITPIAEAEEDDDETFEAPHLLAARTYSDDRDRLFGGVPKSLSCRSRSVAN